MIFHSAEQGVLSASERVGSGTVNWIMMTLICAYLERGDLEQSPWILWPHQHLLIASLKSCSCTSLASHMRQWYSRENQRVEGLHHRTQSRPKKKKKKGVPTLYPNTCSLRVAPECVHVPRLALPSPVRRSSPCLGPPDARRRHQVRLNAKTEARRRFSK